MGRLTLTTLAVITALTLTSCASTPTPQADLGPDAVIIDVRTPPSAPPATSTAPSCSTSRAATSKLRCRTLTPKPPTSSTAVQVTGQESPST